MNTLSPKVSVIVPTLDRPEVLLDTLTDLTKQAYRKYEIIVVDQSETTSPLVRRFVNDHPKIRYIHDDHQGTPLAKNIGAQLATGELLIIVDDDVRIDTPEFLQRHVANYDDPEVGAVAGRVLMEGDPPLASIHRVGQFVNLGLKEITNFNADFRTEVDHVYGCNQSYRKIVFDQAGGFSKIFKGNAHLEESDLSFRVRRVGFKIVFDPKAVLRHLRYGSGGTRVHDERQFRYWLIRNGAIFYLRHYPKLFFPLYVIQKLLWAMSSSIKRRDPRMFGTKLRALWDGIADYVSDPVVRQLPPCRHRSRFG